MLEPNLRLVVGLGNPASEYHRTRHNVGRDFIDHAAASPKSFRTLVASEYFTQPIENSSVELTYLKLGSYMNESGPALLKFMQKKSIKPQEILVVVDEFMIPFGTLRFGPKGSAGGHNGMKSLIETLGSQDFLRLRVGIGPVPAGQDPAEFVLKKFSKQEMSHIPKVFQAIRNGVEILAKEGFEKAATATNKNHL